MAFRGLFQKELKEWVGDESGLHPVAQNDLGDDKSQDGSHEFSNSRSDRRLPTEYHTGSGFYRDCRQAEELPYRHTQRVLQKSECFVFRILKATKNLYRLGLNAFLLKERNPGCAGAIQWHQCNQNCTRVENGTGIPPQCVDGVFLDGMDGAGGAGVRLHGQGGGTPTTGRNRQRGTGRSHTGFVRKRTVPNVRQYFAATDE